MLALLLLLSTHASADGGDLLRVRTGQEFIDQALAWNAQQQGFSSNLTLQLDASITLTDVQFTGRAPVRASGNMVLQGVNLQGAGSWTPPFTVVDAAMKSYATLPWNTSATLVWQDVVLINLCSIDLPWGAGSNINFTTASQGNLLPRSWTAPRQTRRRVVVYQTLRELKVIVYWQVLLGLPWPAELKPSLTFLDALKGAPALYAKVASVSPHNALFESFILPGGVDEWVEYRTTENPADPNRLPEFGGTLMPHRYCDGLTAPGGNGGGNGQLLSPGQLVNNLSTIPFWYADSTTQLAQPLGEMLGWIAKRPIRDLPALMLTGNTSLAPPAAPGLTLTSDLLIHGPFNHVPEYAVAVEFGLSNAAGVITLADQGRLFINQLVLIGLVSQPLPGTSYSSALPLWAFTANGPATAIYLANVVLVVPQSDFSALMSAALRGDQWQNANDETAPLIQAITTFELATPVIPQSHDLVLKNFAAWNIRGINIRIMPGGQSVEIGSGAGGGSNHKRTQVAVGVGVAAGGAVVLAVLLTAVYILHQQRRKRLATQGGTGKGGDFEEGLRQDSSPSTTGPSKGPIGPGGLPLMSPSELLSPKDCHTGHSMWAMSPIGTARSMNPQQSIGSVHGQPSGTGDWDPFKMQLSCAGGSLTLNDLHCQAGLDLEDGFLMGVAPHFQWCTNEPDDAFGVEEGITAAQAVAARCQGTWELPARTAGPEPRMLTRQEVAEQVELLSNGLLGKGATALVWKGRWPAVFGPNGMLAIKVVRDPGSVHREYVVNSFKYEAELLSKCRHPNIVRVYGYCLELPCLCIIMELLPISLNTRLYGLGPTKSSAGGGSGPSSGGVGPCVGPPKMLEVLQLSTGLAAGLAHLHQPRLVRSKSGTTLFVEDGSEVAYKNAERVVHRDLKPANILVNSEGVPKISDFGLAREHQNTTVATDHLGAGTLRYMAPELIASNNRKVTSKVDMFSLGIVMWEMVSVSKPWAGATEYNIPLLVLSNQRPATPGYDPQNPPPAPASYDAAALASPVELDAKSGDSKEGSEVQEEEVEHLDLAHRPADFTSVPDFTALIHELWQHQPEERPDAAFLHRQLQAILEAVQSKAGATAAGAVQLETTA